MSLTMTPPIRLLAFLGALVAAGIAAFLFLVVRPGSGAEAVSPTPVTTPAKTKPAGTKPGASVPQRRASRAGTIQTKSGFPVPVHRALRRNRVVVVMVYMPGARVDLQVRAAARAGALRSGAGYVAISALSERLVRPLVAKAGVLPDPAVLIVKRPDVVTTKLSVTDPETIAQAVVQAKR
jgi:hypothetical protein